MKRATDPVFLCVSRLRGCLNNAIRRQCGATKTARTIDLVGCTPAELKAHIESHFLPGMSWDNRHLWHIDHILPCAAFDMLNPVHQRACFHYTNLQPLWELDNKSKQDKHDPTEVAAWVARFEGAM